MTLSPPRDLEVKHLLADDPAWARKMNERNRLFWEAETKKFEDSTTERPADAALAAKMQAGEIARKNAELLLLGMTNEQRAATAMANAGRSIEAHVATLAESHHEAQVARAITGVQKRRERSAKKYQKVIDYAKGLLAKGTLPRNLTGKTHKKFKKLCSEGTVRSRLEEAGLISKK